MNHIVLGIVIPHQKRLDLFTHEFTDLASYQAVVGGYIEPISIREPHLTLFANEEGKVHGLPVNRRATNLWWLFSPSARGVDFLVGNVAFIGSRGALRSASDLSPDVMALLLASSQFKLEVRTVAEPNEWYESHMRWNTFFDAAAYAIDLAEWWAQVTDVRVVAV